MKRLMLGLIHNDYCSFLPAAETVLAVVLMPDIDTGKPKDMSEKKSKSSKQQECIVCKKVLNDMI